MTLLFHCFLKAGLPLEKTPQAGACWRDPSGDHAYLDQLDAAQQAVRQPTTMMAAILDPELAAIADEGDGSADYLCEQLTDKKKTPLCADAFKLVSVAHRANRLVLFRQLAEDTPLADTMLIPTRKVAALAGNASLDNFTYRAFAERLGVKMP